MRTASNYPIRSKLSSPKVGQTFHTPLPPKKMENIQCDFSTPLDYQGSVPESSTSTWNFSQLNCTSTPATSTMELIQSEQSEFYLEKGIDYGQILIGFFLLLILIFGSLNFVFDFWIPKKFTFKK